MDCVALNWDPAVMGYCNTVLFHVYIALGEGRSLDECRPCWGRRGVCVCALKNQRGLPVRQGSLR